MSDLLVFIYFLIKNYLLYDHLKFFKQFRNTLLVSTLVGIGSLLLNHFVVASYEYHSDLSFIKGAIELPPFTVLLILADVITTVVIIIIFWFKKIDVPSFPKILFEVIRMFIVYVVFTSLTVTFWQKSVEEKLLNTDYICFKYTLAKDLATYYCNNGQFPKNMEQATALTVNPINNSPLTSQFADNALRYTVKDQKNNIILEGYKDFMGISGCENDPEEYLQSIQIILNSYACK